MTVFAARETLLRSQCKVVFWLIPVVGVSLLTWFPAPGKVTIYKLRSFMQTSEVISSLRDRNKVTGDILCIGICIRSHFQLN